MSGTIIRGIFFITCLSWVKNLCSCQVSEISAHRFGQADDISMQTPFIVGVIILVWFVMQLCMNEAHKCI